MTDAVVLRLSGDVDLAVRDEVQQRVDDAVVEARDAGRDLVIDLTDVTFLDSTGLALFVTAAYALRQGDSGFWLASPSPTARRLLDVAGLGDLVQDR